MLLVNELTLSFIAFRCRTPHQQVSMVSRLLCAAMCVIVHGNRLLDINTVDEYMNICMDGISHKTRPGPEAALFDKVRIKYVLCVIIIIALLYCFIVPKCQFHCNRFYEMDACKKRIHLLKLRSYKFSWYMYVSIFE